MIICVVTILNEKTKKREREKIQAQELVQCEQVWFYLLSQTTVSKTANMFTYFITS